MAAEWGTFYWMCQPFKMFMISSTTPDLLLMKVPLQRTDDVELSKTICWRFPFCWATATKQPAESGESRQTQSFKISSQAAWGTCLCTDGGGLTETGIRLKFDVHNRKCFNVSHIKKHRVNSQTQAGNAFLFCCTETDGVPRFRNVTANQTFRPHQYRTQHNSLNCPLSGVANSPKLSYKALAVIGAITLCKHGIYGGMRAQWADKQFERRKKFHQLPKTLVSTESFNRCA